MKRESDAEDSTSRGRSGNSAASTSGDNLHIIVADVVETGMTGRGRRWNREDFARSGFVITDVVRTGRTDDGQSRDSVSEIVMMNVIVSNVGDVVCTASAAAVQNVNVLKRVGQFPVRRGSATPHDAERRLRRVIRRRGRSAVSGRRRHSSWRNADGLPVVWGSA